MGGCGASTTCTSFTYSDWGVCQSDGGQARTVLSSSPCDCADGGPDESLVLTQRCNYVPPANSCTSFTYSAWGACTNGTRTRTVTSSSPSGCTGGSPALTQSCSSTTACTSFTYSAWGTCSNGTQTRTVTSSSPSGCTGGNPVLSQSCSSIDGAALYASKCASCHRSLASSEKRGTTASAIIGKHGTKYGTAAQMQAVADALK